MSRWFETELKLLLPDEAAWRRVREALGPGAVSLQRNHFFDGSDASLAAAGIAVRLRAEDGRFRLAVKGAERSAGRDGVSRRIELEVAVPGAAFESALVSGLDLRPWIPRLAPPGADGRRPPEVERLLAALSAASRTAPLRRTAGFSNRRERLALTLSDALGALPLVVELDRTELPGGRVDHEIEVELDGSPAMDPARVERAVRAWLQAQGIAPSGPAPSKLARLRRALADGRPRTTG